VKPDDLVGELVRRYKSSSPDEREELFCRIASLIQPTILSCVRQHYAGLKRSERGKYKEGEEVAVEIYEYMIEQKIIDRYEGRSGASFQTYIYGVARRYLAREIGKASGGGEVVSFTSFEDTSLDGREGILGEAGVDERSHEEIARAVRGCIEGLSVRERMLIALFYYYRDPAWGREMTDEDVLELLEIIDPPLTGKEKPLKSIEGVSTNRRRAVLRIKKCLEKEKLFERF
jgi:DNA-directed RNA polymerase specialized sigma24 family protein